MTTGQTGRHGKPRLIELEQQDVDQLFNSMDPSPFVAKDLDGDAEEFIVNWAQEYSPDEPVTLKIHLEHWPDEDPGPKMAEAVHNFFAYRAKLNRLEFRRLMQQGRTSLSHRSGVSGRLSAGYPGAAARTAGPLDRVPAGESDDCRLGRHVAADGDIPARLVAGAPARPGICQAEPDAGGSHQEVRS